MKSKSDASYCAKALLFRGHVPQSGNPCFQDKVDRCPKMWDPITGCYGCALALQRASERRTARHGRCVLSAVRKQKESAWMRLPLGSVPRDTALAHDGAGWLEAQPVHQLCRVVYRP